MQRVQSLTPEIKVPQGRTHLLTNTEHFSLCKVTLSNTFRTSLLVRMYMKEKYIRIYTKYCFNCNFD